MRARLASGRARWTALVVVLAVAAAAAVVSLLAPTRSATPVAAAAEPAAAPVVRQYSLVTNPRPAAPAPAEPHDDVPAAAPTGFRISGPAFDIPAKVCGMNFVRPLDPPGDQYHTVCWVQRDFGVAPGTDATGTTYVLGHSWARAPLVLTPLSTTAMAAMNLAAPVDLAGIPTYPTTALNGYRITLTTPKGLLTYTVDSTYAVAKSQAGNVAPLMDETVRNRLVIITCGVDDGKDVDVNIVVNATLTASQATA